MERELEIEETEVYEAPVLAEAGGYTEMTQGGIGHWWDFSGFRPLV
ncbi:lasso RiPP family leader peptide-containing protein [Streptomyces sp. NBRC 109706]|nr:lasso RiPP family leader peptide-containing protein [Streptomyces sp. NBRC 109706]